MRDTNVGFLPICDDSGRILGAVTDRDLAIRLVADDRPGSTPVEQLMTREIVTCRPGDDIREAQRLMGEKHKSRMMCVDEAGHLVGVISLSDIAKLEDQAGAAATMRKVSEREAHS